MAEYMAAAELLITKAGPGTIAEAASLGLPVMLTRCLSEIHANTDSERIFNTTVWFNKTFGILQFCRWSRYEFLGS
jgi:hypothetical protein